MRKRSIAEPTGQLAPFGDGLHQQLVKAGYSKSATKKQLNLVVHLDAWLDTEGLRLEALSSRKVEEFFAGRREEGRSNLLTVRSLAPLVGFLRDQGVDLPVEPQVPTTAVDDAAERFAHYLRAERGLVEGTVAFYRRVVYRFLTDRFGDDAVDIGALSAEDVTGFVARRCRPLSVSSARQSVSALRSFLRFARMEGLTSLALDQAVLSVAGWNPSLPKAIESSTVDKLLASCDRRRGIGRRDYAILVVRRWLASSGAGEGMVPAVVGKPRSVQEEGHQAPLVDQGGDVGADPDAVHRGDPQAHVLGQYSGHGSHLGLPQVIGVV